MRAIQLSAHVIRLSPDQLVHKLDDVSDLQAPVWPGDWDETRLSPLAESDKHRSIAQRYVEGRAWEDTDLFRNIYTVRFARGERPRGSFTIEDLAEQYRTRIDALYASLSRHGFVERVDDEPVKIPGVYVTRHGECVLGNDGNHRIPMAKLLSLPTVLVKIVTRHPLARLDRFTRVTIEPDLPSGTDDIPAMTTLGERFAFYRMARDASPGAVVELGTWLGAATAYMAAGIRDAGRAPMDSFDRFQWKAVHAVKAGGPLRQPMLAQVRENLGSLAAHVRLHQAEFNNITWDQRKISVLVADGPKRVREICRVFAIFGPHLAEGALLAWQDFGHFPSFDLPATFFKLQRSGLVEFVRGVYPGTTAVFRLRRPVTPADVVEDQLRLDRWTPKEIEHAWPYWAERLPPGMCPRFMCGAVLFLYERGAKDHAVAIFMDLVARYRHDIVSKWQMLRETRASWVARYPELDAVV